MLIVVDYIAIAVYLLLLIFIVSSTIYDVATRNKPCKPKIIFLSFSLYSNVRDMLKLELKSTKTIECFHGLRSLSAYWIIAGHRIKRTEEMLSEPSQVKNSFGQLVIEVLRVNNYAVDTFFLMTGVLFTQSCLRSLETKTLNLPKIYINRYIRYMPTVAMVVLFVVSSFPFLIVDGRTVHVLENEAGYCKKWWWTSLLLIQNYVNSNDMCQNTHWYLSADFQLIVISPIFIFILWKLKYKAFWIFGALIGASQLGIFFARYYNTISSYYIYGLTHFRVAQFLIGIALGYIMNDRNQKPKPHMRKRSQLIGWLLSISIFAGIQAIRYTHRYQRFPEAFYISVHRIACAVLVSWIIYVCHYLKTGGILNWFLSHPFWQPIAKISLSIYLIHDLFIVMTNVNTADSMHLNASWLLHIMFGDFIIVTILGAILYLIIEAPSNVIIKNLTK